MKRIVVKSVFDTFDYVMAHYYPYGFREYAEKSDSYAIISIQDSHNGGFGVQFAKNEFCKGVLTLYFDDIVKEVDGATLFNKEMAKRIIEFIIKYRRVDTLIIHCYAGQSRSKAVAAFAVKMMGGNNFDSASPNKYVYDTLVDTWQSRE